MTAAPAGEAAPQVPAQDLFGSALRARDGSDYVFHFWSALGWTVLTLGGYSLYVFYQLVRRSRDHNRRRFDELDAAYRLAWDRVVAAGRAEELRPEFDGAAVHLEALRRMTMDFRDPALWVVLDLVGGGIVWLAGLIVLDYDLVRLERHERAVEGALAQVYGRLGRTVPAPAATEKQAHDYVGRVLATVFSLGFYALWWTADAMRDGNRHFAADWAWEDAFATAVSN